MTPVEYIQQIRLARAIELLIDTDKPIAEVGACAGMPGTAYFITLFKQKIGLTPASYRKQNDTKTEETDRYDNQN